ncbi:hypothetical protein FX988_04041 [Paraglaciecola mesophila]|uniref:Uncharacterized protein n=1 Tax=Paraglaciecola mesophila TaxID=197222 RepID=A0A857JRJ7_9ALTE|nr:hypothetical protein [Paraglaciecola mesophila]QHJ13761.1 hypothetical protein FX988_04041 [Paraglaciecola mesophila]
MLNDLLFSILPREGKSPIAHDELKVKKIDKKEALKNIDEDSAPYRADKDDPREKKRQRNNQENQVAKQQVASQSTPDKKPKEQSKKTDSDDPKFIDIEV